MGRMVHSKNAQTRGEVRKRRRVRAEHREKNAPVREQINEKRREEGHPGWVEQQVDFIWPDNWGPNPYA